MNKLRIKEGALDRTSQGDVFKEIDCIEYAIENDGIFEISKIRYPYVVVLTQDCDLKQNSRYNSESAMRPSNDDKRLLSVLVAPLYNAEHVYKGEHLSELDNNMNKIQSKTDKKNIENNDKPRYHYLDFPDTLSINPQIVDFKHYFSVNVNYLRSIRATNLVCSISELYRESLSQRFASYLSRIGLPDELPMPASASNG